MDGNFVRNHLRSTEPNVAEATHTYTKVRLREPSLAEEGVDSINSHKADHKN